jgi:hypothetical protein
MKAGNTSLTPLFVMVYLVAALVQVSYHVIDGYMMLLSEAYFMCTVCQELAVLPYSGNYLSLY